MPREFSPFTDKVTQSQAKPGFSTSFYNGVAKDSLSGNNDTTATGSSSSGCDGKMGGLPSRQ